MSDASSIRNAVSLPTATLNNEGAIRFHRSTRRAVVSNGSEWITQRPAKTSQVNYNVAANADIATKTFFVANKACRILSVQEVHTAAGNDSGAVSAQIFRDQGTGAAGTGTAIASTTFNLKGTANTVQSATLVTAYDVLFLNPGDRLSVAYTGTLTTLAGVQITVEVEYPSQEIDISVLHNTNANCVDQCFFVANEAYEIVAVSEFHSVLGTNGSAVNVQLVKDTGTNAPGAGTDLLTNNANAGFDLKATINTVVPGVLIATPAALVLAKGDRLSLDYAGTVTAVAGVVVTVTLRPLNRTRVVITNQHTANGDCIDECFFIADRPCQVISVSEVHAVAGNDASAVDVQLVKDTGTNAPGAGTDLLTNNTNVGFDLKATANTVQNGTLVTTEANLVLAKGDRLSLDYAGVTTTLAGVCVSVVLDYINF